MKILLTAINAKYIHSNLAVYSLLAYAKENRAAVEIAEYTINHRREYTKKSRMCCAFPAISGIMSMYARLQLSFTN